MFLNWLLTRFPREMANGWSLLRPDIVVWSALAVATVASPFVVGTSGPGPAASAGVIASSVAGVFLLVLQLVRFDAHAGERVEPWRASVSRALVRIVPAVAYMTLAVLVSYGATSLVRVSLAMLLTGTPVTGIAVAVVGAVILISLLSTFAFVPAFAVLSSPSEIDGARLAETAWLRTPARLVWPLSASRRTTDGARWSIAPYVALTIGAPLPAVFLPRTVQLPAIVLLTIVGYTASAVIYLYFRERRGIVAATSPKSS